MHILLGKWKYIAIVAAFLIVIIVLAGKFDLSKIKRAVIGGPKTVELCFFKEDKAESGLLGEYNMIIEVTGEHVSGMLNFLPAEEDAKYGSFKGDVVKVFADSNEREVLAWWDSSSEGVKVTEELRFIFNEDVASIGFGLQREIEPGVYEYRDPENVAYTLTLQAVPCVLK